ncbi:MAG: hypothetical protein KAK02_03835, partial [Desulfobulbaceae bacterium]|nr:hypothetical protein [Desulfobulbaceae bacterium]
MVMRMKNKMLGWWGLAGFLWMALFLVVTGCVRSNAAFTESASAGNDFFGIGNELSRQLSQNYKKARDNNERLILTTVVSLDDLYQTTRFGRTLTEALSTCLFQYGFGVVEIRKSEDLLIKGKTGELVLTRDAALIARQQEARAIVAGTYSLTAGSVIINLKLLGADSSEVLSVAGMEIPRGGAIDSLLSGSSGLVDGQLSAYER